jgi:hypothetical protein
MGGALWTTNRDEKVANGVLDVSTLAADATLICTALLNPSANARGIAGQVPIYSETGAGKIFGQLEKHGVLKDGNSSFWICLIGLPPDERLKFVQMANERGICKTYGLPPKDLIAGEIGASAGVAWKAMLLAKPITFGDQKFENYPDLCSEIWMPIQKVGLLKSNLMRAIGQSQGTCKQKYVVMNYLRSVEGEIANLRRGLKNLPEDSFVESMKREIDERAELLGVSSSFFGTMDAPCPKPRAEAIEFMQQQTLAVLKAISANLGFPIRKDYGKSSADEPILEQLQEAIRHVKDNINTESVTGSRGYDSLRPDDVSKLREFLDKAEEIASLTPESLQTAASGAHPVSSST